MIKLSELKTPLDRFTYIGSNQVNYSVMSDKATYCLVACIDDSYDLVVNHFVNGQYRIPLGFNHLALERLEAAIKLIESL